MGGAGAIEMADTSAIALRAGVIINFFLTIIILGLSVMMISNRSKMLQGVSVFCNVCVFGFSGYCW